MRFLVTLRNKDNYYTLTTKQRMPIFQKRVVFIEKHINNKKIKDAYFHHDLKGIFIIWDLDSNEEAAQMMLEIPGREFFDIDIQPIMNLDVAVKKMTMYYELALKD